MDNIGFIFVLFLVGVESFQCEKNENLCHESLHEENLNKIRDWWNKVTIQKPLKCTKIDFEATLKREVWDRRQRFPILKSEACKPGERSYPFEMRGSSLNIVNGVIEGTGKLILRKHWMEDTPEEVMTKSCLKIGKGSDGRYPKEIVGTFKNGLMSDNCKIKLSDNVTLIANYKDGLQTGYIREWNPAGELVFVGYSYRDQRIGHCWRKDVGKIVYEDCSIFDRSEDEPKTLVFSSNNTVPLIGLYRKSTKNIVGKRIVKGSLAEVMLKDVYEARIKSVLSLEDCVLQVDYEKGRPLDKIISLNSKLSSPQNFVHEESMCSQLLREMQDKSAPEVLTRWVNKTIDLMNGAQNNVLFSMKRNESPPQREQALILLPEIKLQDDLSSVINLTVMNGQPTLFNLNNFHLDKELRCHGFCDLSILDDNQTNQIGSDPTLSWRPKSISGEFVHGILQGPTYLLLDTDQWLISYAVDGILHGPLAIQGVTLILPGRKKSFRKVVTQGFGFLGNFVNGRADGNFWIGMRGGGFLHGVLDKDNSSVTGNDISYIYPDMETVFKGTFQNKLMKHAQESSVMEVGCDLNGLMKVTKFQEPSGPIFYYGPPTNESFGAGPPGVRDPFERKWLELKNSSILSAGEGVFLRRDAPGGSTVSLYTGFFYDQPDEAQLYLLKCTDNTSLTDDQRRACKKYSLGLMSYETTIDIPPEFDTPETFHPTLGPKVNHHFRLNNSAYVEMEHPRWGTIMSVLTYEDLKAGDELFTYYGYKTAVFPGDFPWYFEAKRLLEREERFQEEESERRMEAKTLKKDSKKNKKKRKIY